LTSSCSWVSIQRTTSAIDAFMVAAASRTGARSLAAAEYQKSASASELRPGCAAAHNHAAVRCAPCHVAHAESGVHPERCSPVVCVGS